MEWVSAGRCRWVRSCTNAHVYIPARNVGGLDEKYLSWSTRSTFPADTGYIWCLRSTNRCTFFAGLAIAGIILVSEGWKLDGGNCYSTAIDIMGFPDLLASECGKGYGYLTLLRVDHVIGRGDFCRADADIHVESPFWQGRHVEGPDVQAKIMEAQVISL